uniref:G_PROTEIN_RECEP_F1_2 domain-containing protein n=1 Tax=Panagrellus redivivus TaxID=6233 RepID=A0A7E4V5P9_PANRE
MAAVVNITEDQKAQFATDLGVHKLNATVAGCCFVFVCMNIFVMASNKAFSKAYRVLIALNVTNLFIIFGILGEAVYIIHSYKDALVNGVVPKLTSSQCIKLYTLFQVFADFAMPLIELTMGFERFTTVVLALPRCSRLDYNSHKFYLAAFAGAAFATTAPALASLAWPTQNVDFTCSRQAAFGVPFGVFNYAFNVFAIVAGLALNTATCLKARKIQQSCGNVRKIKCYTSVAVVSTLLVSVPNFISIIHATWFTMPENLMTPAPILACVNCALQFFINVGMNEEYRYRFFKVFTCGKYHPIDLPTQDTNLSTTQGKKSITQTLSIETDELKK